MPTLVVWGRHDHREIPGARKVVLEASAHLPNEEEPGPFNTAVAGFLASIP